MSRIVRFSANSLPRAIAMPRRRKTVPELVTLGTCRPDRHRDRDKNPKADGTPTVPAWLTGDRD